MKSRNSGRLIVLLLLSGLSLQAMAGGYRWPSGSGVCSTTLQACIDGAVDGERIYVATDGPINEQLVLEDRNLTLLAADGFHPRMSGYYGIAVYTSSSTGDLAVTLDGLTLTYGEISMSYSGVGTGTFEVKNSTAKRITVRAHSGTLNASVYNNHLVGTPEDMHDGLVRILNTYATLNADVYFNRVESSSTQVVNGSAILIDEINGSSGKVKLLGNIVRGSFSVGGIFVSEGQSGSTISDFDAYVYSNVVICSASAVSPAHGINFTLKDGSLTAQVVNNTVSACEYGVKVAQWSGSTGGTIDGIITNNVVVGAEYGLLLKQPIASGMSNDYNLINATRNINGGFTLGSQTITAPAKLVSGGIPRPTAGSPAIDAADTATLGFGLIFADLPMLDADGLRRFKGPGTSAADIGAYEYGDLTFMHTVSASSNTHVTTIHNPVTDGDPLLNLFATPNFDAGGAGPAVTNNHAFGSWYSGSHWTLFQEDTSVNMRANAHFNVFVPAKGGGVFRHVATAGNTSNWSTRLDDSSVNDKRDRIVLVNQNYTAGAQYNNHPVGVGYFAGGGPGVWSIYNLDHLASGGDMPIGAGFSVYAQQPSPNAFRVSQPHSAYVLILDHPLLNDTPCAQVAVTRIWGTQPASGNFEALYDTSVGRWKIFSYDDQIEVGEEFNVVVNPAQVELCRDVIFADGFE